MKDKILNWLQEKFCARDRRETIMAITFTIIFMISFMIMLYVLR